MNPTAIAFWAFCAGLGFLIAGTFNGAVGGAVVGIGISLIASALPDRRRF